SFRFGVRLLTGSEGFVQAALAIVGCVLIAWAVVPVVLALGTIALNHSTLSHALALIALAARGTWWRLVFGLGIIALLDVWRVRASTTRAMRMTAREVREERAEAEIRPEVRARQRRVSVETARSVSSGAIRRATAVVANPTHVAIALRYAPPEIDVPIVVSRGADLAAMLVRSIAVVHDIPIIESPELARTLFARTALNEPIPEECFESVAAIFALLLQTRGFLRGQD
ncbi:MAG: EscU/YscU/HrcU family type III secretion system export apparatus switch protein, partial [Candidatus Eremiobacteraeota bacterium]|nr:EscU/YscU/HrcU family type III secretion system export apparatus switch protein [Candidatus Eremiobacteraeota bacterium]